MTTVPVIIAAAGVGSRLGLGMPKCLVPVNGVPIINYLLYLLRDVADVRVVVGFRKDDVCSHIAALRSAMRSEIRCIANDAYERTKTLQSFLLGAEGVTGNCLCIDGDMLLEERSFADFLRLCADGRPRIAVSEEITDDPIYADAGVNAGAENDGSLTIRAFDQGKTEYEWANVAHIPSSWLAWDNTHMYVRLQRYLPCAGGLIRRLEVDTPQDLRHAERSLQANPEYCRHL